MALRITQGLFFLVLGGLGLWISLSAIRARGAPWSDEEWRDLPTGKRLFLIHERLFYVMNRRDGQGPDRTGIRVNAWFSLVVCALVCLYAIAVIATSF